MKTITKKKTKAQRRIAIVNDAIKQLELGTYVTGNNGYVNLPKSLEKIKEKNANKQAKAFLLKNISPKNYCDVCAKGSLFLSAIRKENDLTLGEIESSFDAMKDKLTSDGLFSEYNINLIEIYYENWKIYLNQNNVGGWVADGYAGSFSYPYAGVGSLLEMKDFQEKHNKKIEEIYVQYQERKKRLLWILNNMKSNQGIFKPLKK